MKSNAYTNASYLEARADLIREAGKLGLPEKVSALIAKNLRSERSIRRMTGYLRNAHPTSMEEIADEMLAIMEDRQRWIEKKQNEESNMRYNAWLNSEIRGSED